MLYHSGRAIFIAYPIMAVVATVAVVLRCLSKSRTQARFAVDDFFSVAALLLFYAYTIVFMYGLHDSGGTLVILEMQGLLLQLNEVLKWIWISEIFMTVILTCVKLSVLVWFWSIFAPHNSDIRLPMVAVGVLCVAWGLAALLLVVFQCVPVRAAWDMLAAARARCIPFGNLIVGYELTNMLLDVAILALPIRALFRLRMSLSRKITVAFIFCLGGFVAITCIIRIIYMYNPDDPTKVDMYRGMLWSSIEMGVAILCSCLPTLGRLLPAAGILPTLDRWFGSLRPAAQPPSKLSFVNDTWPLPTQVQTAGEDGSTGAVDGPASAAGGNMGASVAAVSGQPPVFPLRLHPVHAGGAGYGPGHVPDVEYGRVKGATY